MPALLICLTINAFNLGLVQALITLARATNRALFLLDNEHDSPLYCRDSLALLATSGPQVRLQIPSTHPPETALCIPMRSDIYAPYRVESGAQPALCALLQNIDHGSSAQISEIKAELCASL